MKNIVLSLLLTFCFGLGSVTAQVDGEEILMKINGKDVSKAEFVRIYKKNNTSVDLYDQKALDDYLDLFINFKLKVAEAESLGLDTARAFIDELIGYRKQLAKPYLVDQKIDEELIEEAYERLKYDIKASHILIKLDANASPDEEQKAYDKALKIRNRILKGESFDEIARKESDDKSASSNGGNLGYFSGFQMVYPFETAAYNTKIGELSMPVKTRFGYHIVKVEDKRPTMGKITVSHIMVSVSPEDGAKEDKEASEKIEKIYKKLTEGADFKLLAKEYSDDKGSASKGGELPEFGTGRMVPEFEDAAFSLKKPGEYTRPFKTAYGYHIVMLNKKTELKSFEEMKQELKSKISKDSRSEQSRESLISELKIEYNFTENTKAVDNFYKYVTDSILIGTWDGEPARQLKDVLFTLSGMEYKSQDFVDFLLSKKMKTVNETVQQVVARIYKKWVDMIIIGYEEDRLEEKYPEFRYLMSEYHDGILLFELSDEIVWTKAVKDTIGLEKFFSENRNNYMWGERADASIYTFSIDAKAGKPSAISYEKANKDVMPKVVKLIEKRGKKGYNQDEMNKQLSGVLEKGNSNYTFRIEDKKFEKGDSKLIDKVEWKEGIYQIENDDKPIIVLINKILIPEPKELKDSRGQVTADYQTFLEKEWIKELRAKSTIDINREVYNSIK